MTDGETGSRLGARQRHVIGADLAELLAAARRSRGWSLREAARRVGVAHGTIAHLEHCRRAPSTIVADAIATAYELAAADAEWLRSAAIANVGKSSPLRARFGHGARRLSLVAVVHTGPIHGSAPPTRIYGARPVQWTHEALDGGPLPQPGAAIRRPGAGVRRTHGNPNTPR